MMGDTLSSEKYLAIGSFELGFIGKDPITVGGDEQKTPPPQKIDSYYELLCNV